MVYFLQLKELWNVIKMISTTQAFDTHAEFRIRPYKTGVRLVKPKKGEEEDSTSIQSLFRLPQSVYFLNHTSQIIDSNAECIEALGAGAISEVRNKKAEHFFKKKTIKCLHSNDEEVMRSERMKIIAEPGLRLDGASFETLAFKFPWYYEGKVIGVFGCSLISPDSTFSSLSIIITQLLGLGIFDSSNISATRKIHHPNSGLIQLLTPRQYDVFNYILRAKTAKQIGKILSISNKTVEHHTAEIKSKLQCQHKNDIIDKFLPDE